ncbi:hypothetical protein Ahy_B08g092986 [Arachis hypogaea]|uniref:Uncharacterized protein n=1 Tax=Arachis hypogaea TaxID=3818 RepID=A0A444Y4X7_ARAHY|nr:hypothetical protein Ahy_B08g092986 [Arachis hypogaea]
MADELLNVNGGLSISDSIPVTVQPSDVTSHSEGLVYFEFSRDYNVGSTSNASNSMAAFRQHVEESHHDLVNLLTQQMTTILNPMMDDHESKFDRLARQVERIARIVDYDEGERHDARGNNEGFKSIFQNKNNVLSNRENPQLIPHGQNADDILTRLHANQVAYVAMESSKEESDLEVNVDLAELKKDPPYVRSVYPGVGDGLLEFLMQQKLKDQDVSLRPRCNTVFDTEATAIFKNE